MKCLTIQKINVGNTLLVEKYGTYTTVYGTKCDVVYGAIIR